MRTEESAVYWRIHECFRMRIHIYVRKLALAQKRACAVLGNQAGNNIARRRFPRRKIVAKRPWKIIPSPIESSPAYGQRSGFVGEIKKTVLRLRVINYPKSRCIALYIAPGDFSGVYNRKKIHNAAEQQRKSQEQARNFKNNAFSQQMSNTHCCVDIGDYNRVVYQFVVCCSFRRKGKKV